MVGALWVGVIPAFNALGVPAPPAVLGPLAPPASPGAHFLAPAGAEFFCESASAASPPTATLSSVRMSLAEGQGQTVAPECVGRFQGCSHPLAEVPTPSCSPPWSLIPFY